MNLPLHALGKAGMPARVGMLLAAMSLTLPGVSHGAQSPEQIRHSLRSHDRFKNGLRLIAEDAMDFRGGEYAGRVGSECPVALRPRWLAELSKHFNTIHITVWNKTGIGEHVLTGGKFLAWSQMRDRPAETQSYFRELNALIRDVHAAGMDAIVDIRSWMYIANETNRFSNHNWESGFPGAQGVDLKSHPELRAEVPDPKGGGFLPVNTLDWCNPNAVEYCLGIYRWVNQQLQDVDSYMFSEESFGWMRNHPQSGVSDWYALPAFSEHALADFRRFVDDPTAKFPSPKEFPNTPRTFNTPAQADWDRWMNWLRHVHARFVHQRAEVSYEVNRDNSRFLGQAIYGDVSSIGGKAWGYYTEDPATVSKSAYVAFYVLERLTRGSWAFWEAEQDRIRGWIKAIRDNGVKYIYWAQPTRYGDAFPPAVNDDVRQFRQYMVRSQFDEAMSLQSAGVMAVFHSHFVPFTKEHFARGWQSTYAPEVAEMWQILRKKYGQKEPLSAAETAAYAACAEPGGGRPTYAVMKPTTAVKIDGDLAEWADVAPIPFGRDEVLSGLVHMWRPEILSGELKFQCDDKMLYVAVRIGVRPEATPLIKLEFCTTQAPATRLADVTSFYSPADPAKGGFHNARTMLLEQAGGQFASQPLPGGAGRAVELAIPFEALRRGFRPRAGSPLPVFIQLDTEEPNHDFNAKWANQLCRIEAPATWGRLTFGGGQAMQQADTVRQAPAPAMQAGDSVSEPPNGTKPRVAILASEPAGTQRTVENWPVNVGVALPKGALRDPGGARVVNAAGREWPSQMEAACRWWPDGKSVQWLLVDTFATLRGGKLKPLFVEYGAGVKSQKFNSPLKFTEDDRQIVVQTGRIRVAVNKKGSRLFDTVWLDRNGDGRYATGEEILATDQSSGLYWVDSKGVRYEAARDPEANWTVEKQGPARVTLRGEGWFVNPSGKKVMKQITRLRFHALADWVRVYQTFIWTEGLGTDIRQISLESKLAAPTALRCGVDGKARSFAGGVSLVQDSYRHLRIRSGGNEQEATRLDGWLEASTPRGRVVAVLRDCAEQQPKGFSVEGDRLRVDFYPPHAKPLSLSEEQRLTRRHRQYPDWVRNKEYSVDPSQSDQARGGPGIVYNPKGFAKTHEVVYRFLRPDAPADEALWINDLVQRPVVTFADPKATCAAKPFGVYLPAKDTAAWPKEEAMLDAIYRWGTMYDEEMEDFEFFNFGDVRWCNQTAGRGEGRFLYRYWGQQCKGFVNDAWYLFARSGERDYLVRGEQYARHVMDVDTISHGERAVSNTIPKPPVIGAQYHYGAIHWAALPELLNFWPTHDYLYLCYYLTGYERAREMAKEVETSVLASDYARFQEFGFKKLTPGGDIVMIEPLRDKLVPGEILPWFTRSQYGTLWQLSMLGMQTGNRQIVEFADRYQRAALMARDDHGFYRGNYMDMAESQVEYHLATGDKPTAEAIIQQEKRNPRKNVLLSAYAYGLSGARELLEWPVSHVRTLAESIDLGPDAYNRGAFPEGAMWIAAERSVRGTLATLGQSQQHPEVTPGVQREWLIDPAPDGAAGTGQTRVAYLLEPVDGAIQLDVQLGLGFMWDQEVDLRVLAPSGKEVLRRSVTPTGREVMQPKPEHFKEGISVGYGMPCTTAWQVSVPADGEKGVYTIQAAWAKPAANPFQSSLAINVKSSSGKLVWHVPGPNLALWSRDANQGTGAGALYFRPAPSAQRFQLRYTAQPIAPWVLRAYDSSGREVGNTESTGPDEARGMLPQPKAIDAPISKRDGLWSFRGAVHRDRRLQVEGALPLFSMTAEEWFDPREHGTKLELPQ